jgi:hypothetical protein
LTQNVVLHRRVEVVRVAHARQAEAGGLVAAVKVVVEDVEARQSLVDVLRGEADAVVVIPAGPQRLVDVAVGRGRRDAETRQHVRIVLVVERGIRDRGPLRVGKVVAREAVALRRVVRVVQVGRNLRDAEAAVVRGQLVAVANQDLLAVFRVVRRARHHAIESP